jgi:hypothetical protein
LVTGFQASDFSCREIVKTILHLDLTPMSRAGGKLAVTPVFGSRTFSPMPTGVERGKTFLRCAHVLLRMYRPKEDFWGVLWYLKNYDGKKKRIHLKHDCGLLPQGI